MASSDPRSKKALHVSSGGFRVDRAKALEKLRAFQTPDPELFMLPWVRAAVAGGATRIALDLARTGDFTMSFDGSPVRADQADPSVALFGTNPDARLRYLAVGILAALRLRPKLVTLSSGTGPERRCLRLGAAGDSFDVQEADTTDTILWVIPWEGVPADRWHIKVLDATRSCPARMVIGGSVVRPFDGKDAIGLMSADAGRRIWLEPLAEAHSLWQLSLHGVGAGFLRRRTRIPTAGFIDDPQLTLDASQTNAVRNEAHSRAAEAADAASERLAIELARSHRERLARLGWLRRPDWLNAWSRRMTTPTTQWPPGSPVQRELVETAASVAFWLRRVRGASPGAEVDRALRDCPLNLEDVRRVVS